MPIHLSHAMSFHIAEVFHKYVVTEQTVSNRKYFTSQTIWSKVYLKMEVFHSFCNRLYAGNAIMEGVDNARILNTMVVRKNHQTGKGWVGGEKKLRKSLNILIPKKH